MGAGLLCSGAVIRVGLLMFPFILGRLATQAHLTFAQGFA
jgi:hypothetical protein